MEDRDRGVSHLVNDLKSDGSIHYLSVLHQNDRSPGLRSDSTRTIIAVFRSDPTKPIAFHCIQLLIMSAGSKKRPRADLLSSLDAAFASAAQPTASKYTIQAAEQTLSKANTQQAYQQSKRKRKDKKENGRGNGRNINEQAGKEDKMEKKKMDPLYEKMSVELLALGLKDCSLVRTRMTC